MVVGLEYNTFCRFTWKCVLCKKAVFCFLCQHCVWVGVAWERELILDMMSGVVRFARGGWVCFLGSWFWGEILLAFMLFLMVFGWRCQLEGDGIASL